MDQLNLLQYLNDDDPSDIEIQVEGYTGYGRLQRLLFISEISPTLKFDALKMAIEHVVRHTTDGELYQSLFGKIHECISEEKPLPEFNQKWLEEIAKTKVTTLENYQVNICMYKALSLKESIRICHEDLGDFYLKCGDFQNALAYYSQQREYSSNYKGLMRMYVSLIKVTIYMKKWDNAYIFITKALEIPILEFKKKDKYIKIMNFVHSASGIVKMQRGEFQNAIQDFQKVNGEFQSPNDFILWNNICYYGTLCALATLELPELRLFIVNFKSILEFEPPLRDILNTFLNFKFDIVLKKIEDIREYLLLDIFVSQHIPTLYMSIRNRALITYVKPYVALDMKRMARVFQVTVDELEDELIQLILRGEVNARIDSQRSVLIANDANRREEVMHSNVLRSGIKVVRPDGGALIEPQQEPDDNGNTSDSNPSSHNGNSLQTTDRDALFFEELALSISMRKMAVSNDIAASLNENSDVVQNNLVDDPRNIELVVNDENEAMAVVEINADEPVNAPFAPNEAMAIQINADEPVNGDARFDENEI